MTEKHREQMARGVENAKEFQDMLGATLQAIKTGTNAAELGDEVAQAIKLGKNGKDLTKATKPAENVGGLLAKLDDDPWKAVTGMDNRAYSSLAERSMMGKGMPFQDLSAWQRVNGQWEHVFREGLQGAHELAPRTPKFWPFFD